MNSVLLSSGATADYVEPCLPCASVSVETLNLDVWLRFCVVLGAGRRNWNMVPVDSFPASAGNLSKRDGVTTRTA